MPVINGLEFSESAGRLEGVATIGALPRLAGHEAATGRGEIRYAVQGGRDSLGRPGLGIRVDGSIELICQRCLEPMSFELGIDDWVGLARTEAEIDSDPTDGPDRIPATPRMSVAELLEEEVLLALPISPRHEADCSPADAARKRDAAPFGSLRRLIE